MSNGLKKKLVIDLKIIEMNSSFVKFKIYFQLKKILISLIESSPIGIPKFKPSFFDSFFFF